MFSPSDPRFRFPGQSGSCLLHQEASAAKEDSQQEDPVPVAQEPPHAALLKSDLLARPTSSERHTQVLYSANDYIKYAEGAEASLHSGILGKQRFKSYIGPRPPLPALPQILTCRHAGMGRCLGARGPFP